MKRPCTLGCFVLSLIVALGVVGCQQERAEEVSVQRPKVNLPRTPPLKITQPVLTTVSGAYTVAGLFASPDELLGGEVVVEGVVLSRHVCTPNEDDQGKQADSCYPPPHLTLADDLASTRQSLLVVGGNAQISRIEEGESVTLKGAFRQWSRGKVFVRSTGLLELLVEEESPESEGE